MNLKRWFRAHWADVAKGIGAVGASIVALIISYAALNVSEHANRITDQQTQILRHQQLPVFQMKIVRVADPTNSGATREQLTIDNLGGPVSEFDARPVGFIEVSTQWTPDGEIVGAPTLLPIYGYFGPEYVLYRGLTNNMQGQMAAWFGPPGAEYQTAANQLIDQLLTAAQRHGIQMGARIVAYVDIHYVDTFGSAHREVYQVNVAGGGRVTDATGYRLLDALPASSKGKVHWLELNLTTGDEAFNIWKEKQPVVATPNLRPTAAR